MKACTACSRKCKCTWHVCHLDAAHDLPPLRDRPVHVAQESCSQTDQACSLGLAKLRGVLHSWKVLVSLMLYIPAVESIIAGREAHKLPLFASIAMLRQLRRPCHNTATAHPVEWTNFVYGS